MPKQQRSQQQWQGKANEKENEISKKLSIKNKCENDKNFKLSNQHTIIASTAATTRKEVVTDNSPITAITKIVCQMHEEITIQVDRLKQEKHMLKKQGRHINLTIPFSIQQETNEKELLIEQFIWKQRN